MTEDNAFAKLKLPVSFGINITTLNSNFKDILLKQTDEGEKLATTTSYSILKDDLLRGEEILRIFHITQESVEIPNGFFEDVMELDTEELTELSGEIYKILLDSKISQDTIEKFAKNFMMYKYINKAFLQAR